MVLYSVSWYGTQGGRVDKAPLAPPLLLVLFRTVSSSSSHISAHSDRRIFHPTCQQHSCTSPQTTSKHRRDVDSGFSSLLGRQPDQALRLLNHSSLPAHPRIRRLGSLRPNLSRTHSGSREQDASSPQPSHPASASSADRLVDRCRRGHGVLLVAASEEGPEVRHGSADGGRLHYSF